MHLIDKLHIKRPYTQLTVTITSANLEQFFKAFPCSVIAQSSVCDLKREAYFIHEQRNSIAKINCKSGLV